MTDQELIELAAKAAGIEGKWYRGDVNNFCRYDGPYMLGYWNPLTSSGDCAEMEDKLMIDICWWEDMVIAEYSTDTSIEARVPYADHNNNFGAARRMASTKVAADIGRRV
jgi:hypothetical protein